VLEAIDAQTESQVEPVADSAQFAGALIAHRYGLPSHELPVPRADELLTDPGGGERPMRVVNPSAATARAVLWSLRQEPYGIDLAPESLMELRCGTDAHTLCLNQQFTSSGSARALLQRKSLLALVALQSREGAGYSVSYIVLVSPSRGQAVDLLAPRCTGDPAIAGSALVVGDKITFSLRSVRRPGARGVFLDGTIELGRVAIARASVSVERQPAPAPARAARA
jgi:hypothetical protein